MRELLIARAAQMGIAISNAQADQFAEFHRMLACANARTNLTRVPDDVAEAIDRNYLDSIAPVRAGLPAGTRTLVDIGAGAGFPGIPLSIMLPEIEVTLLDSLGKRVDFMKSVVRDLGLHAHVVNLRAEEAGRMPEMREAYDATVSRAVAPLSVLSEFALPLLKVGGCMIAYKGPAWKTELAAAQQAFETLGGRFQTADCVEIPGRDWTHVLLQIEKAFPTPQRYPRRPGMPEKRPL